MHPPDRGLLHDPDAPPRLAVMMSGGGALAAYQVGALCALAEAVPDLRISVLCGVSAGAINAIALGSQRGDFATRTAALEQAWLELTPEHVFQVAPRRVAWRAIRWVVRLGSGGLFREHPRSLLGTEPLRRFLEERFADDNGRLVGVADSVASGELDAVAITASSYTSGKSTTWVETREDVAWDRDDRIGRRAALTIDHVMASAALPLLFPAIRVGGEWCGDGGVLLTAPLSPAVHLGADRILAVTTRYRGAPNEPPDDEGYPPPARVAGLLLNALFLDQFDADALRLERINHLISFVPPHARQGLRKIDLLVLRPSIDLSRLASVHEIELPWTLRFMTRGLGTQQTRHDELLSLLMFEHSYLRQLIAQGRADANARIDELRAFVTGQPLRSAVAE
ncbi:MAG TPA: patatin-like phospholipase family protein [Planctomycetota bacterium]|nr:patatin-like phospholipase family protein [Planctomycetota bacterium]